MARCVRRAWLWGVDEYAGKDYSHRKNRVIDRLRELSSIFAIEICAFAVMSNHYHTVLYVASNGAREWQENTVIQHWKKLFRIPDLVERYRRGEGSEAEHDVARELIAKLMRQHGPKRCNPMAMYSVGRWGNSITFTCTLAHSGSLGSRDCDKLNGSTDRRSRSIVIDQFVRNSFACVSRRSKLFHSH